MLVEKMLEISSRFNVKEIERSEVIKMFRKEGFPVWVQRQSDLPTYWLLEESKTTGYKPQSVEDFRLTNGSMDITFDGRYWICSPKMTEEYQSTDLGSTCLEDFRLMDEGDPYVNTSNKSSERRHCIALAKAAAMYYKLAFVETKDVEAVEPKRLQNKERRVEIYKFGNKMLEGEKEVKEVKETPKATEGKTNKKDKSKFKKVEMPIVEESAFEETSEELNIDENEIAQQDEV